MTLSPDSDKQSDEICYFISQATQLYSLSMISTNDLEVIELRSSKRIGRKSSQFAAYLSTKLLLDRELLYWSTYLILATALGLPSSATQTLGHSVSPS